MSRRIAGDAVSRCPIHYVATIRITTFNTYEDETEGSLGDRWTAQILISFAEANRIFNRYGIQLERGHRENLSIQESRSILGMEELEFAADDPSGHEPELLLREGRLDDVVQGEFTLTDEVRAVLGQNRGSSQEVCSYWLPRMSAFGKCYHNVEYPGLDHEGIFIRQGVHLDTMAHELGHLFTRSGHIDFVAPYGEGELPASNLMWPFNESREEPRELNDMQVSVMRRSQYVRLR